MELGKFVIGLLILGVLIHYFVLTFFMVSGQSMEPSFHDNEAVLASRVNLFTGKFKRGDAMILRFPGDPEHKKYIKRLIGVPGDTVAIGGGKVYVNGRRILEGYLRKGEITLPEIAPVKLGLDDYFLIGDNRNNSFDSRHWGVAHKNDMIGPVVMALWPSKEFGFVITPDH